jgi:hypothetical protein
MRLKTYRADGLAWIITERSGSDWRTYIQAVTPLALRLLPIFAAHRAANGELPLPSWGSESEDEARIRHAEAIAYFDDVTTGQTFGERAA